MRHNYLSARIWAATLQHDVQKSTLLPAAEWRDKVKYATSGLELGVADVALRASLHAARGMAYRLSPYARLARGSPSPTLPGQDTENQPVEYVPALRDFTYAAALWPSNATYPHLRGQLWEQLGYYSFAAEVLRAIACRLAMHSSASDDCITTHHPAGMAAYAWWRSSQTTLGAYQQACLVR